MEEAVVPAGLRRRWSELSTWISARDPGYLAVKRSVRAAVVIPVVFGLTHLAFTNSQTSLFGAFGAFSLLLLVDFHGRPRTRLGSYGGLFVVGVCFITLGTVVSTLQGGSRRGHGRGRVRRAFRGDPLTTGGDGIDGRASALRAAGRSGPAGLVRRSQACGLGRGVHLLHTGVHVDLADAVARRTPSAPVGHRGRSGRGGLCAGRGAGGPRGTGSGQDRAVAAPGPVCRYALSSHRRRRRSGGRGQAGRPGRVGGRQHDGGSGPDSPPGAVGGASAPPVGVRNPANERFTHLRRQRPSGQ